MSEQSKVADLQRLRKPGVLIRIDGSAEVFYIDEKTLAACRLPDNFQIGGKANPDLFRETDANDSERVIDQSEMTGDELQRELNKPSLFRKTNLLNAFFCFDGPFIQAESDGRVQLAVAPGKGHKPITRFPSF